MPTARWTLHSKVPWIARSSHSISVTPFGVAAVYGGELKPRTPVDAVTTTSEGHVKGSVHLFGLKTPATTLKNDGWRTLKPKVTQIQVPEPRVGATAVYAGDALYMWGGRGGTDMAPLKGQQVGIWKGRLSAEPAHDVAWERVAAVNEDDAPEPRSYHTAVAHAGKVYIHAGCPVTGRLGTLHSFDIEAKKWQTLASGPDPGRGGTALAPISLPDGDVILRYGGFCGDELPTEPGTLDIYSIDKNSWSIVHPAPDEINGSPGARSVHGFVPFTSPLPTLAGGVALLFHGERDASSLGHAGAGTFWDDVWLLTKRGEQLSWQKVDVAAASSSQAVESLPEGRGWFAATTWVDEKGNTRVVMHGGLLSSNERSDELWELQIE